MDLSLLEDSVKRASWLDPDIEGRFARIGEIGDGRWLEDHLGSPNMVGLNTASLTATGSPFINDFNTWDEISTICLLTATRTVEEIGREHRVLPEGYTKGQWRDGAFYWMRDIIPSLVNAGELRLDVDEQLRFEPIPRTIRAQLAVEMVESFRDDWRFRRCDYCTGWHRIRRARLGLGFCSRRCITAANRKRLKGEN